MKQPNVLLIFTDQQRSDSLGCYGFNAISTPHLDRLAKEGALFENCYCDNPVCTPSRASILTGKPLPGHGVYQVHNNLSEEFSLFPKHLKEKKLQYGFIWQIACKWKKPRTGSSSSKNRL